MHIPAGFGQLNLQFTGTSCPHGAEMTFGFEDNTSGTLLHTIAVNISTIFQSDILPSMNNTVTLSNTHVKLGPNATGPFADAPGAAVGGASNTAATPNMALLVKKLTNTGGRHGRGRVYIPGVAESWVDPAGNVLGSVVTAFQTGFNNFLADMSAANLPLYVLHGDPLVSPFPITSFAVESLAATQRRRMRR